MGERNLEGTCRQWHWAMGRNLKLGRGLEGASYPETRRAPDMGALLHSGVYVTYREAPAAPRRDALSPRCAHPRLSPCHTSPTPQPRFNAASIAHCTFSLSTHHVGHRPHFFGDAPRRHGHPFILRNNPLAQASLSTLCDRVHFSSHAQRPPTQRHRRQGVLSEENHRRCSFGRGMSYHPSCPLPFLSPSCPLPQSALRVHNGDDCFPATFQRFFDPFYTRQHLKKFP